MKRQITLDEAVGKELTWSVYTPDGLILYFGDEFVFISATSTVEFKESPIPTPPPTQFTPPAFP